ncbi:hypothetical protein ACFQY4_09590 [Catellatospora bangladeshensis]|uniref:hypothetical protein n=1 Tax=Catellatospora bangladeshensis TaxID=310355 RepID=UPI003608B37F
MPRAATGSLAAQERELEGVLARAGGTLDGLLRRAAAVAPHRSAIQTGSRALTFGELDAAADAFAAKLSALLPRAAARAACRAPWSVSRRRCTRRSRSPTTARCARATCAP